jgi:hypothetical protein
MSRSGNYKDLCPASTDPATVKEAMLSLASYFFKLDIAGKTTWDTSHHIKGEKAYALHKLEEHRRITLENAKEFVTGFLREAQPSTLTQYYRECAKNEIASEHCHVTDAPKDSEHTDAFCDINGFISLIYHITVPSGRYHVTMGFDPTLPLPHGQPPSFDICAPSSRVRSLSNKSSIPSSNTGQTPCIQSYCIVSASCISHSFVLVSRVPFLF